MFTPKTTSYVKYPIQKGLGYCDLPISIDSVVLPPFGGAYLFRVLTFINGVHNTPTLDIPLEQDIYEMYIEIPDFITASVSYVTNETLDSDNFVSVSLTVGIPIPYEGAINLNLSTWTQKEQNIAAWPVDLGFGIADNSFQNIPCAIYFGTSLAGTGSTLHPNARCYIFVGSQSAKKTTIV